MQIYDISLTLSPNLPVWPGDPAFQVEKVAEIGKDSDADVSALWMSAHTGTHVDAPAHFIAGAATVESLDLSVLVGSALVVSIPGEVSRIDAETIEDLLPAAPTPRVLFKTRNSRLWEQQVASFKQDFVAIDVSGAKALLERGVRLVGVDYLSVAPFREGKPTHRILLGAGVVLLEGLDLSAVAPGQYDLYCLPLKIAKAEGAPARAILVKP